MEPISSITHGIGVLLSIAGLVLMVVFAALYGTTWHVVGFAVFGSSLVLLYLASTIYHVIPVHSKWKSLLRRFDHAMVFVLIAGTYTALCLTALRGGWGWSLFGVVWGLAIIGLVLKLSGVRVKAWFSTILYLGMGWLVVIALVPLVERIPILGLAWLIIGGLFYTLGVLFFALDVVMPQRKWWNMHDVFHVFVMLGSISHFWLMFKYVLFL